MKKKFFSKHGFTIVEVMVAFVIFAIMAGMVSTILVSTMRAKEDNNDVEAEITQQKQVYYGKTQERDYDSSENAGKLTFSFEGVSPVNIDYAIGDPNAADADNVLALEYFIGDVDYDAMKSDKPKDDSKDDDDKGSGSVADRFQESNIYGSNGIQSIYVVMKKDTSYTSGNRYFVAAKAVGEYDPYDIFKQVRLTFPSKVLNVGRKGYSEGGKKFTDSVSYDYNVAISSPRTIRIAPVQTAATPESLFKQGFVGMYVELESPLADTSESPNLYDVFGLCATDQTDKSAQSDGSYKFTRYLEKTKDDEGKDVEIEHVNIFAAIEKPKTED